MDVGRRWQEEMAGRRCNVPGGHPKNREGGGGKQEAVGLQQALTTPPSFLPGAVAALG